MRAVLLNAPRGGHRRCRSYAEFSPRPPPAVRWPMQAYGAFRSFLWIAGDGGYARFGSTMFASKAGCGFFA